jgi:hypothetical protein
MELRTNDQSTTPGAQPATPTPAPVTPPASPAPTAFERDTRSQAPAQATTSAPPAATPPPVAKAASPEPAPVPETKETPADPLAEIRAELESNREAHRRDVLTLMQVPKDLQDLPAFKGDPRDEAQRAKWETEFRALAERLSLPVRRASTETAAERVAREMAARPNKPTSVFYDPEQHRQSLIATAEGRR